MEVLVLGSDGEPVQVVGGEEVGIRRTASETRSREREATLFGSEGDRQRAGAGEAVPFDVIVGKEVRRLLRLVREMFALADAVRVT